MTSMSMSRDTRMGLRMVTTLVGISNLPAPHLIYIYIYTSLATFYYYYYFVFSFECVCMSGVLKLASLRIDTID